MPKYRKLHVKALDSLDINDMPDDFTRLFWVLLPLALDSEGRGQDNLAWLRSKVFPLRMDVTPDMIDAAVTWFAERHMIARYEVDGRRYFWIPTFAVYQGDTRKEADSIYPPPPGWIDSRQEEEEPADTPAPVPPNSGPTPDLLPPKSASDATTDAKASSSTDATTATDAATEGADAPVVVVPLPDLALVVAALAGILDERTVKKEIGDWPHPEHAAALVEYAQAGNGIKSVPAFVRSRLREGWTPPIDERQTADSGHDGTPPVGPAIDYKPPAPDPDHVPNWPDAMRTCCDRGVFDHHFKASRARFVDGKIIVTLPPGSIEIVERRLRPTVERILQGHGKTVVFEAANDAN